MKRVDDFIIKLEANETTPNERRSFIESLTKKEISYFLQKDFTSDNTLADVMRKLIGSLADEYIDNTKSVDTRTDFFEEHLDLIQNLIEKFTIEEVKELLPKIKPEYVTIKNMFLGHLINLIHHSKEEIDVKKIAEFKKRIENNQITYEDIRSTLLKMNKKEFSFFICIGSQENKQHYLSTFSSANTTLENMYEYQATIIAEILEEYTEDEIIELIPLVNDSSLKIRKMFFKCLNEKKANEIFLTNAPKYSKDIYNYVMSPTTSNDKDRLITNILSDSKLYSLYSESDLNYLRSLISNGEIILDEESNVINTREEDIISEAAKFIANIRSRDKESVKRGIQKKLSAKKLHDLLNEVNKGLKNISEPEISYAEFIKLMEMPISKAVLFLKECTELSETEKKSILNNLFKNNFYKTLTIEEASNRIINKYMSLVTDRLFHPDEEFDFVYRDLLEIDYNKEFLDQMLENFSKTLFAGVPLECTNIFLAQIIEGEKEKLGLDLKKEFYVGRAYTASNPKQGITFGAYSPSTNTIKINTNVFSELCEQEVNKDTIMKHFLYRTTMIETVFHELRHAYQKKAIQGVSNMRDFYFMLDDILHHEVSLIHNHYKTNYKVDSREVDADLYSKLATALLFKKQPNAKALYWHTATNQAKELAKKRKAPQLRTDFVGEKNIVELFFLNVSPYRIQKLRDEHPMLDLIVDEEGYQLSAEGIQGMIYEIEHIMATEAMDDESFEQGETLLNFLTEYMKKTYNKKAVRKKIA